MAWYNAGTITATNNSGTITGAGTAFISNIRVGDGVTIAGSASLHEVTNIVSETQLTVSPVYPGTTGGGKTYGVVPVQGYTQGLADQAKQLILSYSTIIPSSGPYDTTPGRLLRVGDFGLGSTDLVDYGGDVNLLYATGFYLVGGAATNQPGGLAGQLTVKTNAQNHSIQTFESQGTTNCYERASSAGVWTPWRLRYNQSTILGTVSQTSGIPTGAVMEFGSNVNGQYYKFANGLMLCLMPLTPSVFNNTSNLGVVWTFPATFVSGLVNISCNAFGVFGVQKMFNGPNAYSYNTVNATISVFSLGGFVAGDAAAVNLNATAVGRWF